jgi:predicted MPP superfamily phosphohydrolase
MRHLFELFLFFIVLMALPDWYIYRHYIRHWKNKWMRLSYWIPSVSLLVAMGYIFGGFAPESSLSALGVFLVVFLCINVPKALFSLLMPLVKKTAIGLGIALLAMAYLIFGATEGKRYFQVKETTIESKDVPQGFDGYRIVQLSDIHVGSWNGNTQAMEKAVSIINDLQPDLIVFTGDLVNNLASELDNFIPVFSKLKAKDGVYSVLGNHDYSTYIHWENPEDQKEELVRLKQKQAEMGWTMLNNRHVKLYNQNDSIALIGVENSGRPPFPDYAKLSEAMQGTEGMFQILLSHDPTHWRREVLPQTDIELMLAGHTHAMQTKIFGFTPAQFIYEENDGLYQEGEQMLYVNIGLGHLLYPMRLGAWPEITLLTLRKSNK